ncbi:MAG: S41 family peptidase [Clostridia bacterium]|nr:S41 family peptidase [Clostridia bacterium]
MDFNEQNILNGGAEPQNEQEKFQKKHYITLTVLLVILSALITFIVTYAVMDIKTELRMREYEKEYNLRLDQLEEFESIVELYNSMPAELRNIDLYRKLAYIDYYYRSLYLNEIDEEKLIYAIANSYIIGAEDKFGAYYSADEFDEMMTDTEGNLVGIGVYVSIDTESGNIKLLYVMKNGPAHEAGMLPGDVITHVGDTSVAELGYYQAIDAIKGKEGTSVKVTYVRGEESYTKELKRAKVEAETVIYSKHESDPKTGVIRIVEFDEGMPAQFKKAVDELVKGGCTSLVFDLRNNPGGTLTSVLDILDFLLPKGVITSIRYADGSISKVYHSDEEGEEFDKLYGKDIKMAVLVNGNTASAAELFTCTLKDYGRAVIVGEKTYGKGCGQNIIMLPDGDGIALTTFLYDPPKSKNYNGVGIEPDIVEPLSEEASQKNIFELTHSEDNQLNRAVSALK